jgi:asparagine synthase (glutamine-hydrolysing)
MLVGVLGASARRNAATATAGACAELVEGDVTILAWPTDTGATHMMREHACAVEGRFDLAPRPRRSVLSTKTLREARGDFALFAATPDGLLVGSGLGSGHRPIYVAKVSQGAIACTRLEQLLGLLDEQPKLDVEFLAQSVLLEPILSPTLTPYVGVHKVPQGEAWLLGGQSIRRERIVRPLADYDLRGTEGDLAEHLRDSLRAALRRAVPASGSFAIAASGGLDSSALVALAHGLSKEGALGARPYVFNWAFGSPTPTDDDAPYFRSLARHLGIVPIPVTITEALEDFGRHMVVDAGPCCFPSLPFWTALSRVARERGIETVISGIGGDQVLEGDPRLFSDLAVRGHPLRALRAALRLRGFGAGNLKTRLQYVARPAIERLRSDTARRRRASAAVYKRYPWAGPRLRAHLETRSETIQKPPSLGSTPSERYEALLSSPSLNEWCLLRSQAETVCRNTWREPFLDDDFMRFVATLPPLSLLHGDYRRGMLREASREIVPDHVRLRETKASFTPPLVEMITKSNAFRVLGDLATVRMLADLGLVDPGAFASRFERARREPLRDGWAHIWKVLSTEAFLRQHAGERPLSVHATQAA